MNHPSSFVDARDLLLAHRLDYQRAVDEFDWPRLDRFNWALDYFDAMAAGNDAIALWLVDADRREKRMTFAELSARSSQTANFLRDLGVGRGDHLLLMVGNESPMWEVVLAVIKLGAVVIPATTLLAGAELRDRLERGAVRHVVARSECTGAFADLPGDYTRIAVGAEVPGWRDYAEAGSAPAAFSPDEETNADDPLLLYFTSGTTARPKLVRHTHRSYPVGHLSTMYWLGLVPGDLHWNISSPGWAKHAWSSFFAPWNAGAGIFAYDYARFGAADVLAMLERHPITTLCAPPTVWRMLVQEDLAAYEVSLRELASAGEPLNPEVIEHVRRAFGITIRDGYGQTETTALIGNPPGQPVKAGAMGRALPGYRITLLDTEGEAAAEGEVCVALDPRPAGLMPGYADDEHTARVMAGGWYHTGDVARRDEDGFITFIGRTDDVFKSSDYRISPFELESVLIEHPAVAEAAVVPSPDALRHSVPKAFVTLAPGHAPDRELAADILTFCRQRLPPYKRIRRLQFAELPKTISGKIRRVELRGAERDRDPQARGALEFFEEDFR